MRPGRFYYLVRRKLAGGVRASYYREIVRPRILKTAPVTNTNDLTCEIHVLTSIDDWMNLVWALKSFYYFARRRYALCIHDDGTLTRSAIENLSHHFPQARVIGRAVADLAVMVALESFPRCLQLRRSRTLSLKSFDFRFYLQSPRMLLLDSDVLFFAEPTELLSRIESSRYELNTVNSDISSAYSISPLDVNQNYGIELVPRFNSGLGLIQRDSVKFEWIEEFLHFPGILDHPWVYEQTLLALCSSRFGVELLPDDYTISLDNHSRSVPCRHYVGKIRQWMYSQGIANLCRNGFLSENALPLAH